MNSSFSWREIDRPFYILAPMVGITQSPFRRIAKKFGADVVFSEMVSSDAIFYESRKTLELLKFYPEERPFIVQIFAMILTSGFCRKKNRRILRTRWHRYQHGLP
jgi:tRNA-dihydrouridine synthase B